MIETKEFNNLPFKEALEQIGKGISTDEEMEAFKKIGIQFEKIKCPYCGYEMPIIKTETAECKGVFVKCKGRNCGKQFEIRINK